MSAVQQRASRASVAGLVPLEAPRLPIAALHLFVLSAFAVAQPLFAVLADSPEFFVVRGSTRWDVVLFALVLILVPPAVLLGIEAATALADRRLAAAVHLVFVGALVGVIALPVLKRLNDAGVALVVAAAAIGALAALAYAHARAVRSFLTVLGPAPLVFAGLFLLGSPVAKITLAGGETATAAVAPAEHPPIVFVVFDELPTSSLMDARGRIDAVRYPNFAALAGEATWFRNATTVHEHSTEAVPSLLTGRLPEEGALPFASDHPNNLFTLLEPAYRFRVFESATRLCPQRLCSRNEGSFRHRMSWLAEDVSWVYLHVVLPSQLTTDLPDVTQTWGNFGGAEAEQGKNEAARFDKDIDTLVGRELAKDQTLGFKTMAEALKRESEPTLSFVHTMLPHSPWDYLPSGRRYANGSVIRGLRHDTWGRDPWLVTEGWQRHLLQTMFVDRMLGTLLARLRSTGLLDRSLVVVTADHGVSFRPGERRRGATRGNLADIALVPLFVKRPGQERGEIRDEHLRSIDVLPSLADLLGLELPGGVDGRSSFAADYRPDPNVRVYRRAGEPPVDAPFSALVRERADTVRRQIALFGTGSERRLFELGRYRSLLGRAVNGLRVEERPGTRVSFDAPRLFRSVEPGSALAPSHVSGDVRGDLPARGQVELAVAVNGRIAALTRTFGRSGQRRFAAIVPEQAFRRGANDVEVFALSERPARPALARLATDG